MLTSCETVSNFTDKVTSSDDASDTDSQLLSNELGSDPTLEEILADAEMGFEDTDFEESNLKSDDQLEVAEEKLPANPTTDYDTTLIESDESSDLILEEETFLGEGCVSYEIQTRRPPSPSKPNKKGGMRVGEKKSPTGHTKVTFQALAKMAPCTHPVQAYSRV